MVPNKNSAPVSQKNYPKLLFQRLEYVFHGLTDFYYHAISLPSIIHTYDYTYKYFSILYLYVGTLYGNNTVATGIFRSLPFQ